MRLTLKSVKNEPGNSKSLIWRSKELKDWRAGQFLRYTLRHDNPDDRGVVRWFTIASAPFEEEIVLTTRFYGEKSASFKKALFNMKEGDTIEADGLEGNFVVDNPDQEFIFIAGGIGITPYRSIILDLDNKGIKLKGKLLYGNRDEDLVFEKELESVLSKHSDFSIHKFIGDNRIDEQVIKDLVPDISQPMFYVSGPEPMVESFEKMLGNIGVFEEKLKRDFFPGYSWP